MVSMLISLLVLALVVYVAILIIDMLALTHPFNQILKVIVALLALLYFLQHTGLLHGAGL